MAQRTSIPAVRRPLAAPLAALLMAFTVGGCSCAIGRPGPTDGAVVDTGVDTGTTDAGRDLGPDDTGVVDMGLPDGDAGPLPDMNMPDTGNACPNALPGEPASCGDGIIDTEALEVCDPCAPAGLNNPSRCRCDSPCEEWVPDPTLGQCFGQCRPKTGGYGVTTCDDAVGCTIDTIVSGSAATCDVVCSNVPFSNVDDDCDNFDDDCNGTRDDGYVPQATTCGVGACASTGVTSCVVGIESDSCTEGTPAATDTSCNDSDDDCNGLVDDGFVPTGTTCGVGACGSTGTTVCNNGAIGDSCVPRTPALDDITCNGVDDDCDGMFDEDFASSTTTCGLGECVASGTSSCSNGMPGDTCVPGLPTGTDDNCNGLDEDCDGVADDDYVETLTGCGMGACAATGLLRCVAGVEVDNCTPGQMMPTDTTCDFVDDDCNGIKDDGYVSLATTCGVGGCATTGSTACINGVVVDSCVPNPPGPDDANCNGVDDDCNGARDDGYVTVPTTCGVGACVSTGSTFCTNGSIGNTCVPRPAAASDATCNGIDDDCNGTDDEDFVVTATSCGIGACERTGTRSCVDGSVVNSCAPGTPSALDVDCDGIDDDCNGARDDGYTSRNTTCGVGACGSTGTTACSNGVESNSCMPGAPATSDTDCDGIDDDCNGIADDGYVALVTNCGVGACRTTGLTSCVNGGVVDSCMPLPAGASDTSCNNIDDNCNGLVDDGYVSLTTSCGVGACGSTGTTSCSAGMVLNSCVPGTPGPSDTTCNGVDENCNGFTDEGYVVNLSNCGVGACASVGLNTCVGGAVVSSCTPGTPAASDASCNNTDDDCNGQRDEDYVPLTTNCGVGSCASTGATACVGGSITNSCTPGTPAPSDATCNATDDDCNGLIDEDYVATPTMCGTGPCASTGSMACVSGMVVNTCMTGSGAPNDTTCNGVNDDCDGGTDEDYVPVSVSCGVGACVASGVTMCTGGTVQPVCTPGTPAANDASCNNSDDDCNGSVDEDYVVTTTTCGVGACQRTGALTCSLGVTTDSCVPGMPAATDNDCDNVDDDCNGQVDEDYVGTTTTCGVGACASTGITTCNAGGILGNTCTPGTPAASDATCNDTDDDCNGARDEDYVSTSTACGVGACASTGATSCVAGVVQNSCTPGTPAASDATCNGVDNDCNGQTDEDYVSTSTSCGVGACAATGATSCVAGAVQNSCTPGTPAANDATCNATDDDCNGQADEDYVSTNTTCGVGACASTGTTSCSAGTVQNSCVPGTPAASDATCNNSDDDCNGQRDEDYVPVNTTCGVGACASTGTTSCSMGMTLNSCVAGMPAANDASCNGVDNDCNGQTDEDYMSSNTTCGVGACASTGTLTCSGGTTVNSCVPGTPAANDATCNNVDDDCSGQRDEDYVITNTTCGVGACLRSGQNLCMSGAIVNTCSPGTATTETCNALDDDCNGVVNNGNPGGGGSCVITSLQGVCRNGIYSCGASDTSLVCTQTVFPTTETCNSADDNCDGSTDNNVIISSDTTPTSCGSATGRTVSVGPGASTTVTGTVDPNGDDWFYVTFTGTNDQFTTYRPQITLLSDTSKYRFAIYQSCTVPYGLCTGAAYDSFTMNYAPTTCTGSQWRNCSDNTPRRTAFWVRVFRSPSVSQTDCTGWSIRVQNL